MVFFVKYEFWQNYLNTLSKKGIPVYSVSSIFRPNQIFFRWYGKSYQQVLKTFAHLFVQNEESKKLLAGIGVTNTTVVGDTRFDRVLDINAAAKQLPLVQKFKGDALTFVAGSSWGPDEDIFIKYFNAHPGMKLIIAPHVVNDGHLKEIESKLQRSFIRYTKATEENVQQADCLIIDCYGLLSSIYRYGEISYIGGGFGVGIHNVLEAAVYGIPVIFGPNNKKFREAQHLLVNKGGFEIHSYEDFEQLMDKFLIDEAFLQVSGKAAGDYVKGNAGAMEKILKNVNL
jgi:3-deoxy-D-manno-octulosonic-acid transferase